jgi:hypothetical protein
MFVVPSPSARAGAVAAAKPATNAAAATRRRTEDELRTVGERKLGIPSEELGE